MIGFNHHTGEASISCDTCSFEDDLLADDFNDVVENMKSSGWKIEKETFGGWKHTCPDCVSKKKK